MNIRYDPTIGASKPGCIEHVRVGGWAEVYVASDGPFDEERVVFGYVVRISDRTVTIHVRDAVFSPAKTGIQAGQLIEVDLADICGSEYSPFQIELEARSVQHQIESQILDEHWEEFEQLYPECADGTQPTPGSSKEEWHAWVDTHQRARHNFAEMVIRRHLQ